MKFGENLQSHITHEWRTQYIDYERLKDILYDFKENAPAEDSVEKIEIERYLQQSSDTFFQEIEKELQKVNLFFGEKLNEAARRFTQLKNDVSFHNDAEDKARSKAKNGISQPKISDSRESKLKRTEHSSVRKRISGGGGGGGVTSPTVKFLKIGSSKSDKLNIKTAKELKLACTEFYLNLVLIQNYQELNFTGFRKILKKHDKLMDSISGAEWRERFVEVAPFYTNKQIPQFISQTEAIFINDLEGGDRSKAMKRLRVPPLDQKTKDYPRGVVFRVGLFTGMCIISLSALILTLILYKGDDESSSEEERIEEQILAIKLYRPGFFIWLFLVFIGINIWGWRTAGVNHVLIFEIDPREHLSHQHVLEVSAWLALTWIFSILCFIYKPFSNIIPPYAHPVIYYSFIAAFMLNPIKLPGMGPYYKARIWLLRRGFRLLVTPYYPVEFADFWLADQLNSLASVIMDLEYLICYFINDGTFYGPKTPETEDAGRVGFGVGNITTVTGGMYVNVTGGVGRGASEIPTESMSYSSCGGYKTFIRILLACWPAGIRFAQCLRRYYDSQKAFPHLYNAGKYSTTFFKIGFAALLGRYDNNIWFSLWMVSTVISSCYTLTWDLKMDWGFLESEADNKLLRDEIVYSNPVYYYLAIAQDVLLRFAWLAEFYLTKHVIKVVQKPILKEIIVTSFKCLEVFRRFVWNFFRLENEHLNNCGEFRAVRDISINPLRQDDLDTLFRMMDVDNLQINRKKKDKTDDKSSL
jgi:hypothetical protein